MSKPLKSQIHIDTFLTNISLVDTNVSYIEDKIFPTVSVAKQSDKIAKYGQDHLRDSNGRRADKDLDFHLVEFSGADPLRYDIEFYDHAVAISDIDYTKYDTPFDAEKDVTTQLRELEKTAKERKIASMLTTPGNYTNTATPTTLWDAVGSDPLGDMETASEVIRAATGRRPTIAITNAVVLSKLKTNTQFLNRINGVQKNLTNADIIDIIKNHLGLDEVLVAGGIWVNSVQGQAVTTTDIWNKDFILMYRPKSSGLYTPTFGYRFELTAGGLQGNRRPRGIAKMRHPNDKGNVVEVYYDYQDKILDSKYATTSTK